MQGIGFRVGFGFRVLWWKVYWRLGFASSFYRALSDKKDLSTVLAIVARCMERAKS